GVVRKKRRKLVKSVDRLPRNCRAVRRVCERAHHLLASVVHIMRHPAATDRNGTAHYSGLLELVLLLDGQGWVEVARGHAGEQAHVVPVFVDGPRAAADKPSIGALLAERPNVLRKAPYSEGEPVQRLAGANGPAQAHCSVGTDQG